ncbi:MAG: helix-turn-helix domain-containing protein [Desulfofustis sp.]|jgi:cytoskeleton protein RodZ|nr:helix-turn-helix domain-containing protein [Desulfofustis sp.]
MENRIDDNDRESIGALFRRLRLERSLEVADVAAETRITPEIIRAMEADDFTALPPLAFARGFYGLYAAMLGLDQEEIIHRFSDEYKRTDTVTKSGGLTAPSWQERHVGSMASPPSYSFGTIFAIGLLIVLLIAAGISWYAGYNPASQASKWLRGFQQPPAEQSVTTDQQASPPQALPNESSPAGEAGVAPSEPQVPPATTPLAEGYRYLLVAEFQEDATISIAIDDQTKETVSLSRGTIRTWQARESISLELPADTVVRLFLNGITLPLPPATDGTISLTIPEYLLD